MTIKDKSIIERAVGIIEGIAYSLGNNNAAEGLFNAVEMIDSVMQREGEGDTK